MWLQAWRKIRAIYAKHDPSKLKNIEKMKQTFNTEKKEAKVLQGGQVIFTLALFVLYGYLVITNGIYRGASVFSSFS